MNSGSSSFASAQNVSQIHYVEKLETDEEVSTTSLCTKRRRLTSKVWEDFEKEVKDDGGIWAKCKHCEKLLTGSSRSGTTHLKNHLKVCSKKIKRNGDANQLEIDHIFNQLVNGDISQLFAETDGFSLPPTDDSISWGLSFDHERSRLDMARMIMKHGYPLDMIEHEYFRTFVNNLQPMFTLPLQNLVKTDILDVYRKEKVKIYNYMDNLPCRLSLTICISPWNCQGFYSCLFTSHFIDDDWKLKKRILSFNVKESCERSDLLFGAIENLLVDWNIANKVGSITLDLASTNIRRVKDLKRSIRLLEHHSSYGTRKLDIATLIPEHHFLRGNVLCIGSYAYTVDLIVRDEFRMICKFLHKIRESITYINQTSLIKQKFVDAMMQEKLDEKREATLDDPTVWATTYVMLDTAIWLRRAFCVLERTDSNFESNPSMEEWDMAEEVCKCVKVFYDVTSSLSTIKVLTANVYFPKIIDIQNNLFCWVRSDRVYLNAVASRMKEKFDEYWREINLVLAIAVVLDPRFKLAFVEYWYHEIYLSDAGFYMKRIRAALNDIYSYYDECVPIKLSVCVPDPSHSVTTTSSIPDSQIQFSEWYSRAHGPDTVSQKTEIDLYLEETIVPYSVELDILSWWHTNSSRFPSLARMSRDFLAIPVSTVTSECAFNTRGMMVNPAFNGLDPEIISALICGQNWLDKPNL